MGRHSSHFRRVVGINGLGLILGCLLVNFMHCQTVILDCVYVRIQFTVRSGQSMLFRYTTLSVPSVAKYHDGFPTMGYGTHKTVGDNALIYQYFFHLSVLCFNNSITGLSES